MTPAKKSRRALTGSQLSFTPPGAPPKGNALTGEQTSFLTQTKISRRQSRSTTGRDAAGARPVEAIHPDAGAPAECEQCHGTGRFEFEPDKYTACACLPRGTPMPPDSDAPWRVRAVLQSLPPHDYFVWREWLKRTLPNNAVEKMLAILTGEEESENDD